MEYWTKYWTLIFGLGWARPGKSCQFSSRGKFRILQCPQNSVIRDKGRRESCELNAGVVWSNPPIFIAYPQSIAFKPQFWILNPPFSILLPQISFIRLSVCCSVCLSLYLVVSLSVRRLSVCPRNIQKNCKTLKNLSNPQKYYLTLKTNGVKTIKEVLAVMPSFEMYHIYASTL